MDKLSISGIHHITVLSGNAQRNYDFYTKVLGLRMVKKTVNFDSPTTYHLYYGDYNGSPGTIMTFFPWDNAAQGKPQNGEVTSVMFSIPSDSISYWVDRLSERDVDFDISNDGFGNQVIKINDPDLLRLELVAAEANDAIPGWSNGEIPQDHSIRGFYGAALSILKPGGTRLLLEEMGFVHSGTEGSRIRYTSTADIGSVIDIIQEEQLLGRVGRGSVHHIAFRVADDTEEAYWAKKLTDLGLAVTPVQDRQYFRSIYFREPGGVLFEIATDIPGFDRDEELEKLGTTLKLPAWYEDRREIIEQSLPEIVD